MRIGITGSTGLIGEAFAKLAQVGGHEIIAYSRKATTLQCGVKTHALPAEAPHRLPETQLDALVNLAGEPLLGLWTASKRDRIWKSRVDLTSATMDHLHTWAPENRPKVVLSASGVGYYGDRGDTILDERATRGSGFLAGLCEKWETAAQRARSWGARVVPLRTGVVLATDGGAYPVMQRAFRFGLGGNFGSGRQWMSWIHLDDEVGIMLWALENNGVCTPLNLCAPAPELNSNFTRKLARSLHRPAVLHVPAFVLRLALGDLAKEMLLSSQRAIPGSAEEMGYRFAYPALEDALASLS